MVLQDNEICTFCGPSRFARFLPDIHKDGDRSYKLEDEFTSSDSYSEKLRDVLPRVTVQPDIRCLKKMHGFLLEDEEGTNEKDDPPPCACSVKQKLWFEDNETIEQEVRLEGIFTDEKDIKRETAKRFMERIYVPHVRSIVNEWSGEEEIHDDTPYWINEKGVLMVTNNGKEESFREAFIERPCDRGFISKEEEKILHMAVFAVENGHRNVLFPVLDQNGIRFMTNWHVDDDRSVSHSMKRIAEKGKRDLDLSQARKIIRQKVESALHESSSDDAFVFTDKEFSSKEIYLIANTVFKKDSVKQSEKDCRWKENRFVREGKKERDIYIHHGKDGNVKTFDPARDVFNGVGKTVEETVRLVGNESGTTFKAIRHYIEVKHKKKKEKKEKTVISRMETNSVAVKNGKSKKEKLLTFFAAEKIFRMYKRVKESKKSISYALMVKTGAGGALLHMQELAAMPVFKLSKKEKGMLRSERRKMRSEKKKEAKQLNAWRLVAKEAKSGKKEKLSGRKHEKKRKKKQQRTLFSENTQKKKESIKGSGEKKKRLKSKERLDKDKKNKEKKKGIQRAVLLLNIFRRATRMLRIMEEQPGVRKEAHQQKDFLPNKKKEKRKKISRSQGKEHVRMRKQIVFQFTQAFILFVLVVCNEEQQTQHDGKNEKNKQSMTNKKETTWVLLSILWYLTMVREQAKHGVYRYTAQKKKARRRKKSTKGKKKTKNKKVKRAVIFTYNQRFTSHSVPFFVL